MPRIHSCIAYCCGFAAASALVGGLGEAIGSPAATRWAGEGKGYVSDANADQIRARVLLMSCLVRVYDDNRQDNQ
jgi:hypothetical protein